MNKAGKKTEKGGEPIVKQGLLRKQGGQYKTWKDRWFTLTKEALAYYKTVDTEEPIKRILLKDVRSCRVESADSRLPARSPYFFSVETDGRVYLICARNDAERTEWVDTVAKLLVSSASQKSTQVPKGIADFAVVSEKAPEALPHRFVPKERPQFAGQVVEHEYPLEEFVTDFKTLVRSEFLSDVSFSVQGQNFHAHRAVVASRCPVLAKTFAAAAGKGGPTVVVVEEMKSETFSSVLDFIYMGGVELTPANVVQIHFAAVAYGLDRLRCLCEVYIRDHVDVSNVLTMLVVANRLKEEEIERFLLGYMKDVTRYTSIIKQPQASEIAQTNKDLYVTMSQVLAQAPESFAHCLDKVAVPPIQLTKDISSLLASLDYADLRIVTKDGEVFAHKVIVAARCSIFIEEGSLGIDADLGAGNKYQTLKFPTLEPQVVQTMLEILYSNVARLNYLEDAYGLIELADRVQEESVVRVCEDMMRRNLANDTALKILMVASEYELLALKKETLQLIKKEAPTILKRGDLRTLLSQWPWNLIDIIRALVRTGESDLSEDETAREVAAESEDELEDEELQSTEMS